MMELGGNITLSGFSERDFTELIVVKKIVGQYARRFSDTIPGFEALKVALTEEGHGTLAIHVHARMHNHDLLGEAQGHNLFVALDSALKRVDEELRKRHDQLTA